MENKTAFKLAEFFQLDSSTYRQSGAGQPASKTKQVAALLMTERLIALRNWRQNATATAQQKLVDDVRCRGSSTQFVATKFDGATV